jgi:hypothetical protein
MGTSSLPHLPYILPQHLGVRGGPAVRVLADAWRPWVRGCRGLHPPRGDGRPGRLQHRPRVGPAPGAVRRDCREAHDPQVVARGIKSRFRTRFPRIEVWEGRGCCTRRMNPTSGACTMPCLRQASLLGSTSSPPHALPGEAAHQGQRLPWLTPNDSQGPWSPLRDSRSSWTLRPCHRTVCTAHTGRALHLHCNQCRVPISATVRPWLCRRSAYASVS